MLLAFWRSTVTFHLAPLIVAASVPWMVAFDRREHPVMSVGILAVSSGLGLALATTYLLDTAGRLGGPSLIAPVGAFAESLIMAGLGAVIGFGSLLWRPVR